MNGRDGAKPELTVQAKAKQNSEIYRERERVGLYVVRDRSNGGD
jgi:hypothetical protein